MGLFSGIVSVVGSFISSVGQSLLTGVANVVKSVAGAIGGIGDAIANLATDIGKLSAKLPEPEENIRKISEIVSEVGSDRGLISREQDMAEFGAKAIQIEAQKPDDFESTEAYINHLSEEITLDQETFDMKTDIDKTSCRVLASSIVIKGVEEKTGMELSPEFLTFAALIDIKPEEVKVYMDEFQSVGINNMSDMIDCLMGKCAEDKVAIITDAITSALSKLNPEMSEKEVDVEFANMMDKVASLEESINSNNSDENGGDL